MIGACKKTVDTKNPYDNIVRNNDTSKVQSSIDSNSIVGLHTYIFETKCAISSCHGGPFEPDFRTPQSSYNTLVWQKVIKNTPDGRFKFRVVPGDTTKSWLHERLVTDDTILGRMPRYLPVLTPNEMYHINKWIMDGAKDVNGKPAVKPNSNIVISYFVAYNTTTWQRVDQNKPSTYSPFEVSKDTNVRIYFVVTDDENKPEQFLDNKVLFSTSKYDFNNAIKYPATIDTSNHLWFVDIDTKSLPHNKPVYFRYYGRDLDHSELTEFPNNTAYTYYLPYYSLIVK